MRRTTEKKCFGMCVAHIVYFRPSDEFNSDGSRELINLVDPASSYMLVSKIKPCKSKYSISIAKLRIAHYNSTNLHKFI